MKDRIGLLFPAPPSVIVDAYTIVHTDDKIIAMIDHAYLTEWPIVDAAGPIKLPPPYRPTELVVDSIKLPPNYTLTNTIENGLELTRIK